MSTPTQSSDSTNSSDEVRPLIVFDLSGLGDAGTIVPGYSDGPTFAGSFVDDADWNDPSAAALANVVGPFSLNGETFERPGIDTVHFMGDNTKFQCVGDRCKFFVGYPWDVPHMRDLKPQWWTGVVRMDYTLARVILSLQCINPAVDGVNNMTAEENVRDWFDFATRPADPAHPTWEEIEMRKMLTRVHENAPQLDLRQVAVVAVARMLMFLTADSPRDDTTADFNDITVNVGREAAMRVSAASLDIC